MKPASPPVPPLERVLGLLERRFGWERNYALGVVNGWCGFLGDAFFTGLVISSFAATLGAPNLVLGLLPAIQSGGWLLPQLIVSSRVRHLPRKIVAYRAAASARVGSYLAIVTISALLAPWPWLLLPAFVVFLALNALSTGMAGLPFMEVVAKVIEPRERPAFFGIRNLVGGLLAFAAGFVVRGLLGSSLPFPFMYTIIFAFGTVFYSSGYALFGRLHEPPDPPQDKVRLRDEVRSIPQIVRADPDFAAFLRFRVLLTLSALADPFFTVYALRVIGVDRATLGNFLIVLGLVGPLANTVWPRVATRFGSRRVIRLGLAFAVAAPIIALAMPRGAGLAFVLVYVLAGIGGAAINLGVTNLILSLAPPQSRGRYIGVVNTTVGLVSFAPVLAGGLADAVGYAPVFALGSSLYALTWWMAGRLRREG